MYDMTIRLSTDSGVALYEQIYNHIKKEIKDGKLLAGEKLPSTRSLAEYLQVARSTVDYAYGQLLDEGYIEARPCRGYYVCAVDNLVQLEAKLYPKDRTKATAMKDSAKKYEYDFSPYEIDTSGFPFSVWKKITGRILTDANADMFFKGEPMGNYELRETISRYLHSSRGVNCRPEQIVIGAGNDYLLMLVDKLICREAVIAMENPTYLRPFRIFQSCQRLVTMVNMDDNGVCVDGLEERNADVVYVMPSHQFPSGIVMPIGRRLELLNWANQKPDRYIIEDDYDSEFRYHGKPIPALMASDHNNKVIYLGSFSKSIAPAIRVSFMVLPESLLEIFHRDCYFYSSTVSRIDQCILNEFIQNGHFERHLNKMRKVYKMKHDLLLEKLKPFRKSFIISGENAGLHILLTSRKGIFEKELIQRAEKCGIKVYGLSDNMTGRNTKTPQADSKTVLLGFGALEPEEIERAVDGLKSAWNV